MIAGTPWRMIVLVTGCTRICAESGTCLIQTTLCMAAPVLSGLVTRDALVDHDRAVRRTLRDALRIVVVADALGTEVGLDREHAALFLDSVVRALGLTGPASGARRGENFVGH